jgi:hypothetical protein
MWNNEASRNDGVIPAQAGIQNYVTARYNAAP